VKTPAATIDVLADPAAAGTGVSVLHNVGLWTTRRAAIAGDRPALADAERSLDHAGLHERTCRAVRVLHELGVASGDRVALLLGNRTAYVEALFAASRLGAIAVPVNARFTAREVGRLLADCAPRALLHERDLEPVAREACRGLPAPPVRLACPEAYEEALASGAGLERVQPVSAEHPMILMYTSGTTGAPKGALLPHRKTLYNSLNAQLFFDLTASDRVLVVLPLFHSFGLLILTLPTLYAGGSVRLVPRFDPEGTWRSVSEHGISFLGAVPTQLQALLETGPERFDLRGLRFLFGAGAAVPVEQIRAFERHGLVLKQGFGQTETSILCCLDARDAVRKAGSVGRPVFHAEVRVVRQEDLEGPTQGWRDAAIGEPGEIVVRGPITMLGYWQRPEATAETLRGEWLRTGDLASVDDEGFLTLVGRARDLYISGGENVYPAEVEAVLGEHPSVREVAVVGVPDARWGEAGCAFVVRRRGRGRRGRGRGTWGGRAARAPRVRRSGSCPRRARGRRRRAGGAAGAGRPRPCRCPARAATPRRARAPGRAPRTRARRAGSPAARGAARARSSAAAPRSAPRAGAAPRSTPRGAGASRATPLPGRRPCARCRPRTRAGTSRARPSRAAAGASPRARRRSWSRGHPR
jgi:fatty-acyl-CoA synthase